MAGMAVVEFQRNLESKLNLKSAKEIAIENECPRCGDIMVLCSDFDILFYQCEECDFVLYAMPAQSK